jgi:hypothetical protein
LVHTVTGTAANEHDITQAHALLLGEEDVVFAKYGYRGITKREEIQAQHLELDLTLNEFALPVPGELEILNLWGSAYVCSAYRGFALCGLGLCCTAHVCCGPGADKAVNRFI